MSDRGSNGKRPPEDLVEMLQLVADQGPPCEPREAWRVCPTTMDLAALRASNAAAEDQHHDRDDRISRELSGLAASMRALFVEQLAPITERLDTIEGRINALMVKSGGAR